MSVIVNSRQLVKTALQSPINGYSKIFAVFLARDSVYAIARYMLSPVRSSIRLSVCLSVRHMGRSVKDG